MTHTVHPYAHRLGILRDWKSRWFSADPKRYREFLRCDTVVKALLEKNLRGMYVSSIEVERSRKTLRVIVKTSRPGLIIGRSGGGSARIKSDIERAIKKLKLTEAPEVKLDIEEVRSPESHAPIVGAMVSEGLEKRMPFRRVLKQAVEKVMANRDVKGVKISISGRLGGAEMSRQEVIKKGRVPLQTFRADIDYAVVKAFLPYGVIGIRVWIYRGDVFSKEK